MTTFRDQWPRDWRALADALEQTMADESESRHRAKLDDARRQARTSLEELLELSDYQFVQSLLAVIAEQIPEKKRWI